MKVAEVSWRTGDESPPLMLTFRFDAGRQIGSGAALDSTKISCERGQGVVASESFRPLGTKNPSSPRLPRISCKGPVPVARDDASRTSRPSSASIGTCRGVDVWTSGGSVAGLRRLLVASELPKSSRKHSMRQRSENIVNWFVLQIINQTITIM